MRFSVSNIALPDALSPDSLDCLACIGFAGVELAPGKVFREPASISPREAADVLALHERAGLGIVGLHSLFYEHPELGLFRSPETDAATLRFLHGLGRVCADLGGRWLVFGSPSARRLGGLTQGRADRWAADFFSRAAELLERVEVALVLEPLPVEECEYLHTLQHARRLVREVGSGAVRCHLDAKALQASNEMDEWNVRAADAAHCHVNEHGLGTLQENGAHRRFGEILRQTGYDGWVSLEQRLVDPGDVFGPLENSFRILREMYA